MKKTYITPLTENHSVRMARMIAVSVYTNQSSPANDGHGASDIITPGGGLVKESSVWDDDWSD